MNSFILLILLVPIVEIYLFIKIGSQIGAFNTISLILVTAIIGIITMSPVVRFSCQDAIKPKVKDSV